jgi:hypothetical protein
MAKLFYIEFVVGDWLKDPAVSLLKPATRGIWMDAICAMHELDQCGRIEGEVSDLARICRCTSNEMRAALDDLKMRNAAEITEHVTNCHTVVTLTNRRMRRKWTDRNSCRERKQRQRSRERGDDVTENVTPLTRVSLSLSSSLPFNNPPNPPPGDGGVFDPSASPVNGHQDPFAEFWAAWPRHQRKGDKAKCHKLWAKSKLDAEAPTILAGLRKWKASKQWAKQGGDFIPTPLVWLRGRKWEAENIIPATPDDVPNGANLPPIIPPSEADLDFLFGKDRPKPADNGESQSGERGKQ